jgi:basic membrane protein A
MHGISKILKMGFVAMVAMAAVACTKNENSATRSEVKSTSETAGKNAKVIGLVLDKGGKDDKSFNAAAVLGAERAAKEFGLTVKDVESPDDAAFEPAMRTFAERGMPLIVAIGFAQADPMKKVAPQFPNTHFAVVDAVVEGPNVTSLMFEEHEGSYLVGYLAGLATKTNKVGFVGGMEVALIRRFLLAYEAGVKAANPKAKVLNNFVGITAAAWANPNKGKELALTQLSQGADIIFHAAGASGMGVFDAVEEKKALIIGVDSNQNALKPGRVLTSMLKRVDNAVYDVIRAQVQGTFKPGTHSFGLKDKGIDYAVDSNNQTLIEPYLIKIEAVRADIIAGKISVPDYYKKAHQKKLESQ